MKKKILIGIFALLAIYAGAQTKQEQNAVKSLCGCYEVEFMYAETFAPTPLYNLAKPYNAHGIEWVVAEEASDKKFVLQHLLVISDTMVIKHWREDWEYSKKGLWKFDHDAAWKYDPAAKADAGSWTQTVWETDDAPRYQGTSKWMMNNGKLFWENTTDAPLPRREYSTRSDYNVLERGNKLIITDTGWVHEQDNRKIKRTDGQADFWVASEKGFNIYTKVDDKQCAVAAKWWNDHKNFWNTVRVSWDELLKGKSNIRLIQKNEGQTLSQQFGKLEAEKNEGAVLKEKVKTILGKFTETKEAAATAAN